MAAAAQIRLFGPSANYFDLKKGTGLGIEPSVWPGLVWGDAG
jgi:hypothetical protein